MILKLRSIGAILGLLMMIFAGSASVEAAEFYQDDPKYSQEQQRLSNTKVMNAQALTPGIPCETGACFKTADDTKGHSAEPLIEPAKDSAPAPATKTKGGKTGS